MLILATSCVPAGCGPSSKSNMQSSLVGQQFLLKTDDFNLEKVIALIKENKVKDAAELEKVINESTDINNVDIDNDGLTDTIQIKETRDDKSVILNFLAIPSSTKDVNQAQKIAQVTFSKLAQSQDVNVQGGYTSNVEGFANRSYNMFMPYHGISFGEAFFLAWLFSPGRSLFYNPYPVYMMHRPVNHHSVSRRRYHSNQNHWKSNRSWTSKGASRSLFRGFRRR